MKLKKLNNILIIIGILAIAYVFFFGIMRNKAQNAQIQVLKESNIKLNSSVRVLEEVLKANSKDKKELRDSIRGLIASLTELERRNANNQAKQKARIKALNAKLDTLTENQVINLMIQEYEKRTGNIINTNN